MAGPVRIAILANGSQARREITATQSTLGRFGSIGKRAAALGFGALAFGAASFVKSSIEAEKTYSTTMRLIQAATKASGDEIGRMNKLAIQLGQDTSFSAQDAAGSMLELAKAGLKTSDIMKGGVQGTLLLAAAGGTELSTAATIASNALNTFNLRGRDMAKVAAALAGGANASSASVESLGQGLQQVGPGATNAGLSLQETVAALSAFDAAGIKGSDAGTSLKTMLTRLVPQTDKAKTAMADLGLKFTDAHGNFLSLTQISEQLQTKLAGLTQEERTRALATIFGSDATRAATVLMKNGAEGIRKYIDATKDQNAAQELAKARLSGTEGALERLNGAVETAKLRLGQELAPVVVKGANALSHNLVPALEGAIDAGKDIARELAPAVKEAAELFGDLAESASDSGGVFHDVLLPALGAASDVLAAVLDIVGDLPDPIQDLGVQVGLAALAYSKLSGPAAAFTGGIGTQITKVKQLNAEMSYSVTRTQQVQAGMQRLGGAARAAAGVGGLLALSNGMQDLNSTAGKLQTLLGGAATGFSVGGPVGAIVGLVGAGALIKFKAQVDQASQSTEDIVGPMFDFASSLREVDGAATAATRKVASLGLQQAGAFPLANQLGLSYGLITRAALGNKGAIDQVSAVLTRQTGVQRLAVDSMGNFTVKQGKLADEAAELGAILHVATGKLTDQQRKTRELSLASGELASKLKSVKARGDIVSRLQMRGDWPTSARQVASLTKGLKLTPKEIRTVLRVLGVKSTASEIKGLQKRMKDTGKTKVDAATFTQSVKNMMSNGGGIVDRGGKNVKKGLRDSGKTKVDDAWLTSLTNGLTTGKSRASSGGRQIGANLKSGVLSGIGGLEALLSGQVTAAVNNAIAAGRRAADAHSPSRKMAALGRDMADGLIQGFTKRADQGGGADKAAKSVVQRILDGIATDRVDKVKSALDRINALVEKTMNKRFKSDKKAREATKRAKKLLSDETAAIERNAKRREKIYRKLEKAQEKLRDLREAKADYAKQIKDAALDFASIVNLDTAFNADAMIKGLTKRLEKLKLFADTIRQLAASGLNETTLSQLVNAGVEGGLAEAVALLQGGQGAIDQFNALQDQIDEVAGQLGDTAADEMYDAGIQAAQGLVDGLKSQAKELEKIAQKLARDLIKAIKKELGIKSPSVVFRDLGQLTAKGLTLGLEDIHVRGAGQKLAGDLIDGFGRPQLSAAAASTLTGSAAVAGPVPVRITLTADQLSRIQRGREIQIDLDAYYAAGGKPPAR